MADEPKQPTPESDADKFGWKPGDVEVKQPPPKPLSPLPYDEQPNPPAHHPGHWRTPLGTRPS